MNDKPAIVSHCDWSKEPRNRWMAVAVRQGDRWLIGMPELVGVADHLLSGLQRRSAHEGAVVVGFDFPIGLPRAYGERTSLSNFRTALTAFGSGTWSDWFDACETQGEISVRRPFYPLRPGGTRREHLLRGLGFTSEADLLRLCERKTQDRQAACSLFWTLGGNQVGKGAIAGWREVLAPNIDYIGLWPFDGTLHDLIRSRDIVIAETYPGDVYGQIGIPRRPVWSKRKQAGRASVAPSLMGWLHHRNHLHAHGLEALITEGFTDGSAGEDQFDAMVGLFGMLDVVDRQRPEGRPADEDIERWEGWILGMAAN